MIRVLLPAAGAASDASFYLQTRQEIVVDAGPTTLLDGEVEGPASILILSDGAYSPEGETTAYVFIELAGSKISNDSLTDWRGTRAPVTHSFRAIATQVLRPGRHHLSLIAAGSGRFVVEPGATLSVLVSPASTLLAASLGHDSAVIAFDTFDTRNGRDPLPVATIMEVATRELDGPLVVLASGRSYYAGDGSDNYGDAKWMLSFDGQGELNNNSTYSDNDICRCAELQAPMFVQGFFEPTGGATHGISLQGGVEPWERPLSAGPPDGLEYRVGSGTNMIVMNGAMQVAGHASLVGGLAEPSRFNRTAYVCVASRQGWPGCPATGKDVVIARAPVSIPPGHNGVLLFSGITRIQGDASDKGGKIHLSLAVDGKESGSNGLQRLSPLSAVSTRTVSSSFLAAGSGALATGDHVVELRVRAEGDFKHLSVTRDMPLMWFD